MEDNHKNYKNEMGVYLHKFNKTENNLFDALTEFYANETEIIENLYKNKLKKEKQDTLEYLQNNYERLLQTIRPFIIGVDYEEDEDYEDY